MADCSSSEVYYRDCEVEAVHSWVARNSVETVQHWVAGSYLAESVKEAEAPVKSDLIVLVVGADSGEEQNRMKIYWGCFNKQAVWFVSAVVLLLEQVRLP